MIDKLAAVKIITSRIKYGIKGHAFTFGDQKPTFSENWAKQAIKNIKKGVPLAEEEDTVPMVTEDCFHLCGFTDFKDIG